MISLKTKVWLSILAAPVALIFIYVITMQVRNPETRWDWNEIEVDTIDFPPGFQWGVATSSHQVEGNCNNNWSRWEASFKADGTPRIHNGDRSIVACDHWNRYKEDIELIKALGVSVYRFSVEWSKIEPEAGHFDESAIQHYRDVCLALKAAGITPVVTLHHFTNPLWFEDMGAFENEANIRYFVRFSQRVFDSLKDHVAIWCTINEPAVYTTQGYFNGVWPPGKQDPQLAGEVMKNLLVAHTRVYEALKSRVDGKNYQVGIVKNVFPFDPYNRWNPMDWFVCSILDGVFNQGALDYFQTGKFSFSLPGMDKVKYINKSGIGSLDFIGLNNYSHQRVKSQLNPKEFFRFEFYPDEEMTDMFYPIYPEAIYRSIKRVKDIDVPIIITENGIADKKDDRRRRYIERYLYAVSKAIKEGADVRGYYYWSLMDNFEWSEGYEMKFGLYEVDFTTQIRTLREGSKRYMDIVARFSQ